ncbi:MMPL family transporter [Tepidiforma sp.]|uniref:MMPL family transporter n=1 Tax=Tepidiforma sp. TaxID=2682230 RepID=UPI002ADDA3C6|nr:MMPL family transporter [Tepidiforma sp.]
MADRGNGKVGGLERWARWVYRRRWLVLAVWVVVLVGIGGLAARFGGEFQTEFRLPGSESQRANDLLRERFPAQAGGEADIVFEVPSGVAGARGEIEGVLAEIVREVPDVAAVESPFERPGYVSPDGTIARAVVRFTFDADKVPHEAAMRLIAVAEGASRPGFTVEPGGRVVQFNEQAEFGSEVYGLIAAVFILLIAFGSVAAMGVPIGAALFGLGTGLAVITVAARWVGFPSFSSQFAAMIGIGVGIDYSLLVVTRFREAIHAGKSVEEGIVEAVTTSGRSVIFAGVVVAIAFLGLFVMGLPFVATLATAGAVVVLVAVAIAASLTPALLSVIGKRVDALRVPLLHQSEGVDRRSPWFRLSRVIQRHPWPFALVAGGVLVVASLPILSMELGFTDAGNRAPSSHSRKAYDLIAKGFGPGTNGPLLVVADVRNGNGGLTRAVELLRETPGVAAVTEPLSNPAGDTAVITVIPTTKPQDHATTELVHRLREDVLQRAGTNGDRYYVTGVTAGQIDASDRISARMPYLFVGVIGLSFVLLTAMFRSVVVAAKAAVMNLLSIGAAYGVVVAIFQWGWFGEAIGVGKGPIEVFLPMMMFAILFGLSMDYEVFLISRIREEYLRSGDTAEAVANGLTATARVITAAAAIMVTVFLAFVLGPERVIKEFGVGLATAIFVDATLVRIFLVPATMELLGKWNWWIPGWLDRLLPDLQVEGPPAGGGELSGSVAGGR